MMEDELGEKTRWLGLLEGIILGFLTINLYFISYMSLLNPNIYIIYILLEWWLPRNYYIIMSLWMKESCESIERAVTR